MSKNWNQSRRVDGGALVWVLVVFALVAVVCLVSKKPKSPKPPASPVIVAATPAPATPVPVLVTPDPLPVAVAAPLATPAPEPPTPTVDFATVARTPALWPAQVALLKPVAFPVLLDGRVAGSVTVPIGTRLRLLRVSGQFLEVEHHAQKQVVPATSTDLMQSAQVTFASAGFVLPEPQAAPVALVPEPARVAAQPVLAQPVVTQPAIAPVPATFEQRVKVEALRTRSNKIAGGDWDDKTDRIAFTVKCVNSDTVLGFSDCTAEFYIFAQNILNPKSFMLLLKESFTFSLPPLGAHEFSTGEAVTRYDPNGARFGAKYEGWALVIRDKSDKIIMTKASPPAWLPVADKLKTLTVKSSYGHDLKPANAYTHSR